jgi:hypothetical protein
VLRLFPSIPDSDVGTQLFYMKKRAKTLLKSLKRAAPNGQPLGNRDSHATDAVVREGVDDVSFQDFQTDSYPTLPTEDNIHSEEHIRNASTYSEDLGTHSPVGGAPGTPNYCDSPLGLSPTNSPVTPVFFESNNTDLLRMLRRSHSFSSLHSQNREREELLTFAAEILTVRPKRSLQERIRIAITGSGDSRVDEVDEPRQEQTASRDEFLSAQLPDKEDELYSIQRSHSHKVYLKDSNRDTVIDMFSSLPRNTNREEYRSEVTEEYVYSQEGNVAYSRYRDSVVDVFSSPAREQVIGLSGFRVKNGSLHRKSTVFQEGLDRVPEELVDEYREAEEFVDEQPMSTSESNLRRKLFEDPAQSDARRPLSYTSSRANSRSSQRPVSQSAAIDASHSGLKPNRYSQTLDRRQSYVTQRPHSQADMERSLSQVSRSYSLSRPRPASHSANPRTTYSPSTHGTYNII